MSKDILKDKADELGSHLATYYDKMILDQASKSFLLGFSGKYRNKRVPKYLWITVPVVERHYCNDEDGGYNSLSSGWLVSTRRIRLFKIGTEVIQVPIRKKLPKKGATIKFRRYGELE
jgi:hypothetical protein